MAPGSLLQALLGPGASGEEVDDAVAEYVLETAKLALGEDASGAGDVASLAEACEGFVPGAGAAFERDRAGFEARVRAWVRAHTQPAAAAAANAASAPAPSPAHARAHAAAAAPLDEDEAGGGAGAGAARGVRSGSSPTTATAFSSPAAGPGSGGKSAAASRGAGSRSGGGPGSVVSAASAGLAPLPPKRKTGSVDSSMNRSQLLADARDEAAGLGEAASSPVEEERVQLLCELVRGPRPGGDGAGGDDDDEDEDATVTAVRYILYTICHGDMEDATQWLLDHGLERAVRDARAYFTQKEKDLKDEELRAHQARRRLLEKFDERLDVGAARVLDQPRASARGQAKRVGGGKYDAYTQEDSKLRYRDGKVVSTTGERYILESSKQVWDGGSRGRVSSQSKKKSGIAG